MVKFLTSTLYLSSEGNFISSFVGCPRIFSYPQTGYWAWPFLTQFVHMRLDIGPGLFQRSLNTGYNWSPQYIFIIKRKTLTYMINLMIMLKRFSFEQSLAINLVVALGYNSYEKKLTRLNILKI